MPKAKKYYIDTPKFILYDALDKSMFAYVMGIRDALPSVTLHRAIELFMDKYCLHEDNYPMEQAKQTWYRMHESYKLYRKLDN